MKISASRHGAWLLAMASVWSHQAAHGQAYSSATIGHYQYTLTDLDPNDGIAPSVTWGKSLVTQKLSATVSNGVESGGGPNVVVFSDTGGTNTVAIDTPQSRQFQGYDASSGPKGLSAKANVPVGGNWFLQSSVTNDFVLSAKTAITFTAQADVALGVVVPSWSVVQRPNGYLDNGYFDWAPIQVNVASMLGIGTSADFGSSPYSCQGCLAFDNVPVFARSYATVDKAASKLLSGTFTNDTAGKLGSTLSLATYNAGYATAPLMMVPELAASTQMLLGLAGLGAAVRFGRRRAPSQHA
jgi:hypothetical protein